MPKPQRRYPDFKRYDDPSNSRMVQGDETDAANKRFHDNIAAFRETFYGNEGLLRDYPEVIEYLQKAMEIAEEARPTVGELNIRARANSGANAALEEWKAVAVSKESGTIGELRRQKKLLEGKVQALETYTAERAIPRAINEAINGSEKLSSVPFVYYGWDSQRLIATPATYEHLEIDEIPENLSIRGLFGYVNRENRKGQKVRKELIQTIRKGKLLKYLPAETSESGKEIYISATPYHFSRRDSRILGFGISFNEPRKRDYILGTGLKDIHKAVERAVYSVHKRFKRLGIDA